MRSKTVLSRRGLLVGAASLALAQPPPERYLFRLELRESLIVDYARLKMLQHGWSINVKAAFE